MSGNCPLCNQPVKNVSHSGRTMTCFSGHEFNAKSVLSGVTVCVPGWICWHTRSNSGVSEVEYAYWGKDYPFRDGEDDDLAQELINRYEDWMNHASHGPSIEWQVNCPVPGLVFHAEITRIENKIFHLNAQREELKTQVRGL